LVSLVWWGSFGEARSGSLGLEPGP